MRLVLRYEELSVLPNCLKFWTKVTPSLQKTAIFNLYIRYSASAVTPIERSSIMTNRKSTKSFSMSLR